MSTQPHESQTAQHMYSPEPQAPAQSAEGNPMFGFTGAVDRATLVQGLLDGSIDPRDPSIKSVVLDTGKDVANHLRVEGTKQVQQHLIKGETEAIHGILSTLVDPTNGNLMLDSEFGAGKSTLFEGIFNLIEGLDKIAYVPGRPDLTPEELTGRQKTMANTRTIPSQVEGEADQSVVEYLHGVVYAMIDAETQALVMDEINLNNPRTVSAANSILAKRTMETTRGEHQALKALEIAVTAKNPRSADPSLARLRQSFVDRFSRGVILGRQSEWATTLAAIEADFEPKPELVLPVITVPMLHVAQVAVEYVTMEDKAADAARRGSMAVAYALRDKQWAIPVRTTPYRLFSHLRSTARTEALMQKRTTVQGEDIGHAIRTKVTAVLTGNDMVEDYDQVDDVVAGIASNVRPQDITV
jgi:MoxR-like ATPase